MALTQYEHNKPYPKSEPRQLIIQFHFLQPVLFANDEVVTMDGLNHDKNYVEADLEKSYLSGKDFQNADFSRANLLWARLDRTNLSGARLIAANLDGADLTH